MAVADSELQALVNQPFESLDVELKDWLDLTISINRAKVARHLCALANHGGGYLRML